MQTTTDSQAGDKQLVEQIIKDPSKLQVGGEKKELTIMFNTIANYLPDIEMTGAPTRMRHGWINGITVMPVRFNAR